jgi:hypothetical protein
MLNLVEKMDLKKELDTIRRLKIYSMPILNGVKNGLKLLITLIIKLEAKMMQGVPLTMLIVL